MVKKGLWAVIALILVYVVFDFVTGLNREQEVMEQASIQNELSVQDELNEDIDTEEMSEEELQELMDEIAEQNAAGETGSMMEYGLNAGNVAYDFQLEDMDGNTVQLSDYRGKKVFLNFWASWCPPCRVEMPHLQEFHEEQDEVVVLGVNVISSESDPENVPAFIDEFGLTFTNVYAPSEITDLYRVESLPTSYFIGSDGVIYERVVGPVTKDILETKFEMID
ncbi:TlpA family protein disulfide reductase [Alkalibacterium putridalgicola]|uniref:TlpA family protein disulfide reductase n=1 Tax=Alkalibacterium putridalgicola TaxID=426703 RepID=UPI0034D00B6A